MNLLAAVVLMAAVAAGARRSGRRTRPVAGDSDVISDLLLKRLGGELFERDDYKVMFPIVALLGIALYATFSGPVPVDVYGFGFSPFAPVCLAVAGMVAADRRPRVAALVVVVLLAHGVGFLQSSNLIDYLLDPALVAAAVVGSLVLLIRRRRDARISA